MSRLIIFVFLAKVFSFELESYLSSSKKLETEIDYLNCLNKTLTDDNSFSTIRKTYLVTTGTVLRLECNNLCLNDNESNDNIWVYMLANSLKMNIRSKNTKLLKHSSLEVSFKSENESSTYYCIHNSTVYAIHQIIVTDREPFNLNYSLREPFLSNDEQLITTKEYNLNLFTEWSEWSACNRCPIGLRKRIGICKIKINKTENTLIDSHLSDHGIPCRSPFLHKHISLNEEILKKKSVLLFTICQKECPQKRYASNKKELFEKKMISITELIKKSKFKVVFVGERVVITCNKAFNVSDHYVWRNYSISFKNIQYYYINPMRVHIKTKGRVKIDFMNNLVINYALKYDQRVYRCYDSVNNSTISVTKLKVRSKVKELTLWSAIKTHFATFLIIITIILFGLTLWKNRKLKTKI